LKEQGVRARSSFQPDRRNLRPAPVRGSCMTQAPGCLPIWGFGGTKVVLKKA
jgi:hypothetical protein